VPVHWLKDALVDEVETCVIHLVESLRGDQKIFHKLAELFHDFVASHTLSQTPLDLSGKFICRLNIVFENSNLEDILQGVLKELLVIWRF